MYIRILRNLGLISNVTITLIGETFARESLFFAKVCLAKFFKMAIRERLSSEIFLKHQFAKVYPVKLLI